MYEERFPDEVAGDESVVTYVKNHWRRGSWKNVFSGYGLAEHYIFDHTWGKGAVDMI